MKRCTKCKELKGLDRYSKQSNGRDGKHSQCKDCRALYLKQWYADDPKRLQRYYPRKNAWAHANNKSRLYQLTRIGLTFDSFHFLLISQGARCGICGTRAPGAKGWQTDHDHSCCKQGCDDCRRALLCFRCNMVLGYYEAGWPISIPAFDSYLALYTLSPVLAFVDAKIEHSARETLATNGHDADRLRSFKEAG